MTAASKRLKEPVSVRLLWFVYTIEPKMPPPVSNTLSGIQYTGVGAWDGSAPTPSNCRHLWARPNGPGNTAAESQRTDLSSSPEHFRNHFPANEEIVDGG